MATATVFFITVLVLFVLIQNTTPASLKNQNNSTISQNSENLRQSLDEYLRNRNNFLRDELDSSFGSDVKLTEKEQLANKIIMAAKEFELNIGLREPQRFNPSRHIFDALDDIEQSKLFKIIQKMPKGGLLHTHDSAMCSADCVVSLTYLPDLWQRTTNQNDKIQEFRFSREQPEANDGNSTWHLVSAVRSEIGATIYDARLRQMLTLFNRNVNSKAQYSRISDVWPTFQNIFRIVAPIVSYVPARKAYFKQTLREMLNDGVQYLEFRSNLMKYPRLYDLNGTVYSREYAIELLIETLDEFKRENPSFIGSNCIYAGNRWASKEIVAQHFEGMHRFHAKYPHFVRGHDLNNLEDNSPKLVTYAEHILQLPDSVQLFYHAGETNWFGDTDENLFDAVMLGSRRIGHGYALAKHPKLLELVKSKNIALEINPIPNQVLKLVDDLRNHPASIYLAQNIPIVIASDDPAFWEVTPLSHDFYVTFLGIASRHSDLRTLKKFALNSIEYSAMNATEKIDAMFKWQTEWDKFIDELVNEKKKEKFKFKM